MTIYKRRGLPLLVLLIGLCLTFGCCVLASIPELQKEIEEEEKKKQEEEAKEAYYKGLYDELQKTVDAAYEELDAIIDELIEIDHQVDAVNAQVADLAEEQAELEADIAGQKEAMELRIRYMYESRSLTFWDILAGAGTLADLLNSADYMSSISDYDRRMQQAYKESLEELEAVKAEAEQKQAEILALQADTNARKLAMADQIDGYLDQLDDYENKMLAAGEAAAAYAISINEKRVQLQQLQEAARKAAEEAAKRQAAEAEARREAESMVASDARGVGSTDIVGSYKNPSGYTNLQLLAAILECECGSQTWEGQVAVGNVIYNRILDPRFQMTLYDVIYGPGQFTPVTNGTLDVVLARGAKSRCVEIAQDILNGARVINTKYLYFCSTASWTLRPKKYTEYTFICAHYFYY